MSLTLSLETASIVLNNLVGSFPTIFSYFGLFIYLRYSFFFTISVMSKVFLKNLAGGSISICIKWSLLDCEKAAYTSELKDLQYEQF